MSEPTPTTLRVADGHTALEIDWDSGITTVLAAATLRAECRCAQCRNGRVGPVSEDVTLTDVAPYGPNAVHLAFSDGHARGIYPFRYLAGLAGLVERD